MGIFLGLLAALGWGTSDFIARDSTRVLGTFRTLYYTQFFGALVLGGYLLFSGQFANTVTTAPPLIWLVAVLNALFGASGAILHYRAFQVGVLAIISPITASYGAITTLMALASGETLSYTQLLGIGIILAGIIAISMSEPPPSGSTLMSPATGEESGKRKVPAGLWYAVGSALIYGVNFWILGFYIVPVIGGVFPVWISRITVILSLTIAAFLMRRSLKGPSKYILRAVIGIGALDTIAMVSSLVGTSTEQVSIVTMLSSLFSTVTVLLAWIFLKDPLNIQQKLGIVAIFVGIIFVSV